MVKTNSTKKTINKECNKYKHNKLKIKNKKHSCKH